MPRTVKAIPATRSLYIPTTATRRKVAAYARVSTDSDEQFTSYEAQVDYYTNYIRSQPNWAFVDVYTDAGISGTSTRHRDGFNRMVADALDGKIDLIITKSVSRFARNTVDSLTTIRRLKERGVECYFEKENIWTFDSKGELLITIMSSIAQEESRSISENVTWGHRKRMADGRVAVAYSKFLGYEKGENGLVINPEQAKIVRYINRKFMEGLTPTGISDILTEKGIPTPGGRKRWYAHTVMSILTNEKYKGDALLQKTFTLDYLTKKTKRNEGEVPQYYVKGSHEAIITPEEFDEVQAEIERRKQMLTPYSGKSIFASKVICGDCGAAYGKKVWHSNDKYRREVWRCNYKYGKRDRGKADKGKRDRVKGDSGLRRSAGEKDKADRSSIPQLYMAELSIPQPNKPHPCMTPTLTEAQIKESFIKAYDMLLTDRDKVIENCEVRAGELEDNSVIDAKIAALEEEIEGIVEENKALISGKANGVPVVAVMGSAVDAIGNEGQLLVPSHIESFSQAVAALDERYRTAENQLNSLRENKKERVARAIGIRNFVEAFHKNAGSIAEWDDQLWCSLVRQVTIYADGRAVFLFRGENSVTVEIE